MATLSDATILKAIKDAKANNVPTRLTDGTGRGT